MRRHLAYLRYLLIHKWWVFRAGLILQVPLWRLIVHDWSKFLPVEWLPYARCFYAVDGTKQYLPDEAFDRAWLHHQHCNPHHWQHWVLRQDSGSTLALQMPSHFVREMVADWCGAGRAITGKWDVGGWFLKNDDKIHLAAATRTQVIFYIREFESKMGLA